MGLLSIADLSVSLLAGGLDADRLAAALLGKQYFPNVKDDGEELPPLFSTESLGIEAARELAASVPTKLVAPWVELRVRRFDGLVRRFGIPHPVPYIRVVLHTVDHWPDLVHFVRGPMSQIKPAFHADGRIISMTYDTPESALNRSTRLAQGRYFMVRTDISGCFSNIYSHAIDWALRGKRKAKADRRSTGWEARLDSLVRDCHDGETKGVMIGPALSNLLAEIILQRVDKKMVDRGYQFIRYVDDYTAYCRERSDAEAFVVDLQRELSHYRLDLNNRKTSIADLREGMGEVWMGEMLTRLPEKWTPLSTARYFRYSERLAREYPEASVLKYAAKVARGRADADREASILVVDELVRLCEFHPHLSPFLADELERLSPEVLEREGARLSPLLTEQMLRAAMRAESDVVLWYLYILRQVLRRQLLKQVWSELLTMDDDLVVIATATLCGRSRTAAAKRVTNWEYVVESDRRRHWLARYEFWRVGLVSDSEMSDEELGWMRILRHRGVSFSGLANRR